MHKNTRCKSLWFNCTTNSLTSLNFLSIISSAQLTILKLSDLTKCKADSPCLSDLEILPGTHQVPGKDPTFQKEHDFSFEKIRFLPLSNSVLQPDPLDRKLQIIPVFHLSLILQQKPGKFLASVDVHFFTVSVQKSTLICPKCLIT